MTNRLPTFAFGPFRLDTAERVLMRDGLPVALTPKAIDTLILLVQRQGHIVDKAELMSTVWPDTFVGEDSLTRNVSVLRKVLGNGSDQSECIETVAKRGYRFKAPVSEEAAESAGVILERRTRIRITSQTETDDGADDSVGSAMRSIAVLPFAMLDPSDAEPYLGAGLADALITKLTSIRRVSVKPTSAILKYADSGDDPFTAGRQLGVDSVLSGAIQKRGDGIRVTTQLISVERESALWADTFDERYTDIFALEDAISAKVASALMLEITGEEQRLLAKHHTTNPDAYRLILRGRYFWGKGAGDWFPKAFESFQQAVAIDPNDPIAHLELANCFNVMGFWGNLPSTQAFPMAEASATTALALDSSLGEAHSALGWAIVHHRFDRARAERSFVQSLALTPASLTVLQWYALFLAQDSRFEAALELMDRALELDALNLHVNYNRGVILMVARRLDAAIDQFEKTIELDPAYFMAHCHLCLCYALKGMRAESMAANETMARVAKNALGLVLTNPALLAAMFGDQEDARRRLVAIREFAQSNQLFPSALAQIHVALHDHDAAMASLEQAWDERDPWLAWLKVNPCFDGLRDDHRFINVMRRAGLAP